LRLVLNEAQHEVEAATRSEAAQAVGCLWSGALTSLMPAPIDDERASSSVTRDSSDQAQVQYLKRAAYKATVDDVVKTLVDRG